MTFPKALAHLVPTPCHAAGISPIIGAGRCLGLLLGLLIPTGLPSHARGSPHCGPDGRTLPGITANGAANSPDGGAAAPFVLSSIVDISAPPFRRLLILVFK